MANEPGRRRSRVLQAVASRCGLSLIELVVVIAIVGVAAAVVLPAFDRLGGGGAEEAVRELVSAYRAARGAAVTRGAPSRVTVELATGAYWVISEGASDTRADTLLRGTLRVGRSSRMVGGRDGWAVTAFDPLSRARGVPIYISEGAELFEVAVDPRTASIDVRRR